MPSVQAQEEYALDRLLGQLPESTPTGWRAYTDGPTYVVEDAELPRNFAVVYKGTGLCWIIQADSDPFVLRGILYHLGGAPLSEARVETAYASFFADAGYSSWVSERTAAGDPTNRDVVTW